MANLSRRDTANTKVFFLATEVAILLIEADLPQWNM